MAKKIILTSLLFCFLLCVCMVVNIPANWVYKQFLASKITEYPVQVQTPQGTIWNGHSGVATNTGLPITAYIPRISWSLQYQEILSLKLVYRIDFTSIEAVGKKLGSYYALIGADLDGLIVQIQDDNALLAVEAVGKFDDKSNALITGKVELRRNDPDIQNLLSTIPQIKQDGSFTIPINL